MLINVLIQNKNLTRFIETLEIKIGLEIAVHSAILVFSIDKKNLFSISDTVIVEINNQQMLSGTIEKIKSDNKNITLIAQSKTKVLLNYPDNNFYFNKVAIHTALKFIPNLKFTAVSLNFPTINKIALHKDLIFLNFLDDLAMRIGYRYYSYNDKIYFFKLGGFTAPINIKNNTVLDLTTQKNNKYKYTSYYVKSKNNLKTIDYKSGNDNSKPFNINVSNFTLQECINFKNLLLDVHSEKLEHTFLKLQLDNKAEFLPGQFIKYLSSVYYIISSTYIINQKDLFCLLCLKKL